MDVVRATATGGVSLLCVGLGFFGSAATASSCVEAGMQGASASCAWSWPEYHHTSASGTGHTWVVTLQPANGGIHKDSLLCMENGEEGLWHDVYMDGVDVGDVCVPDTSTPEPTIHELVVKDFKAYSWPKSRVIIQPPGGKTLVNLETVVYTTNSTATSHVVSLAGRTVTIEASPVSYLWHFGEGSAERSGSPGHAYPDQDVFHVYESVGDYAVGVDTVYGNGRYRIGAGEWKVISGSPTVTVTGALVGLQVLEAKPQLVR